MKGIGKDSPIVIPEIPVKSVNGRTGNVILNYSDVGALQDAIVPISKGGTGANNKLNAWGNIIPCYQSPWTDVSQDTGNNWAALGNVSITWWPDDNNGIYNKPSTWGIVLTVCSSAYGSAEMHQLWFTQANGEIWHRGGNGSTATSMKANAWHKLTQS